MTGGSAFGWSLLISVIIGAISAGLSLWRSDGENRVIDAIVDFAAITVVLTLVNTLVLVFDRPMMTFPIGLMPLIFANFLIAFVVALVVDVFSGGIDLEVVVAAILAIVTGIIWFCGVQFTGHSVSEVSNIVRSHQVASDQIVASSVTHIPVVSYGYATTKAGQALTVGVAGTRQYSTYFQLGTPRLEFQNDVLQYDFPIELDGTLSKSRMGGFTPGYASVNAENQYAPVVLHVAPECPQCSMLVSTGTGQGGDPVRWARDHGYDGYMFDNDPVFQAAPDGTPYWVLTLNRPKVGWTFDAPVGVILINAHTGVITKYALNAEPSWVTMVYDPTMATQIVSWYAFYHWATFSGKGNNGRYQVSGPPVLVYTGTGDPSWRFLLTSFNSDTSVYKIVEMNARTGVTNYYTPAQAMGTEDTVVSAFESASGTGANSVYANRYRVYDLRPVLLDGKLAWMGIYESNGSSPSLEGIGIVDAYHVFAQNVVFGSTLDQALQNFLTQLAIEGSNIGSSASQGGVHQTISGVITSKTPDTENGNTVWYVTIKGHPGVVYTTNESQVGPAIVEAQVGDTVTFGVYVISNASHQVVMQSFSDPSRYGLAA